MFPPSKRLVEGSIPSRRAREIKASSNLLEAFLYLGGQSGEQNQLTLGEI